MSSILEGQSDQGREVEGSGACVSPADPTTYQERQAELEYRLLVLIDQLRARVAVIAGELGLTPQQAMLLRHLGQPKTMGEIALILACDRSNVTGLVDRMAARGWVERAVDAGDRRIKHLVLTDEGRRLREVLQERLFGESPSTRGLAPSERWELLLLLRKLTPEIANAEDLLAG